MSPNLAFAMATQTCLVWTVLRQKGWVTAMRCSKCGAENPEGKRFCGYCGAAVEHRCQQCGADNPPGNRFCGDCGAALEASAISASSSSSPTAAAKISVPNVERDGYATPEGERRHLAVLFSDLVGSTEIATHLDPEDWRDIAAE